MLTCGTITGVASMSGARLGARRPSLEAMAVVEGAAGEVAGTWSCDSGMSP